MNKYFVLILFFILSTRQSYAAQILNFSNMKLLSEQTTTEQVFDDAINIAPNFGLTQMDPDLKQYFDPATGKSNLCVPTSLAHFLIYQIGITHNLPIKATIPGVSEDLKSIDANLLIGDLIKRCKTDFAHGTNSADLTNCIGDIVTNVFNKNVSIDRISKSTNPLNFPSYVNWQNRSPDISDIKAAIKNGDPVLASVAWWKMDPVTKVWTTSTGHEFMIYGYAAESYFQDNILQLDIMNPVNTWTVQTDSSDFNIATLLRRKDNPNSSLFLDGRGFVGQESRGYLSSVTIVHIQ